MSSCLLRQFRRPLFVLLLLAGVASTDAHGQAGRQVGVAAAVTGQVQLAAAGGAARAGVRSGEVIRMGDQISTGPDSKLQILLADETVFTIGPNAAMTIDEFVFDPGTGRGKLSADVARGAFRFVTGRIAASNPQDMRVTTPVGTMGIRGTVVAGQVTPESTVVVLLGPGDQNNANERMGRVLVSGSAPGSGTVELRRPGFATEIMRGGAPSSPFRIKPEALEEILRALSSERSRVLRVAASGGDGSPEELAEIETAAGESGAGGNAGQGLADGLRGILSLADIVAMLDRPFPTVAGAASVPATVTVSSPVGLGIPDALVRTVELRSFSGSTVFPVSVFSLSGSTPGSFSVNGMTFDHGKGVVSGTLVVDFAGTRESFPISVVFPGGVGSNSPGSSAFAGRLDPSKTVFAFTAGADSTTSRLIDYRYMLMRASTSPTPDQMLNGLTYQTPADRAAAKTTAVGTGIARTSGANVQLTGGAADLAEKVLQLDVRR